MDRGSSVIVTELERELPSKVLTARVRKEDSALFEAVGYRLPTIAKMLKCNLLVCSCWPSNSKTRERNNTRDIRACVYSPVPEIGNGEIKMKREYVRNGPFHSSPVQLPFNARFFN